MDEGAVGDQSVYLVDSKTTDGARNSDISNHGARVDPCGLPQPLGSKPRLPRLPSPDLFQRPSGVRRDGNGARVDRTPILSRAQGRSPKSGNWSELCGSWAQLGSTAQIGT